MKVNKLVEEEIIKNFVVKNRQERILWELASSKKRDQTFWRFAGPGIFKNECLEKLNYMSPDELESYLLAFIQTEQVYYLGEMYIGKTTIKEALEKIQSGCIGIIYFENGVGYYQGEEENGCRPRYLLKVSTK